MCVCVCVCVCVCMREFVCVCVCDCVLVCVYGWVGGKEEGEVQEGRGDKGGK